MAVEQFYPQFTDFDTLSGAVPTGEDAHVVLSDASDLTYVYGRAAYYVASFARMRVAASILPPATASINSVKLCFRAKCEDIYADYLSVGFFSSEELTENLWHPTIPELTTDWAYYELTFAENPITESQWAVGDFDGIGVVLKCANVFEDPYNVSLTFCSKFYLEIDFDPPRVIDASSNGIPVLW